MKKEIYTLLNEIDNHTDTYETSPVQKEELKNWKQAFAKRMQSEQAESPAFSGQPLASDTKPSGRRFHSWKRCAAAAAAFVFLLAAASAPIRETVYAQSKNVIYSLAELLNINKDISPYRTVVGSSFTKNDITTTLNDVIWDDDTLYVSYTMNFGKDSGLSLDDDNFVPAVDVSINGKSLSNGSGGTTDRVNNTSIICTEEINMPEASDLSGSQTMELEFYLLMDDENNDSSDAMDLSRLGALEFTTSGDELKADTGDVSLNAIYSLPNDTSITFNRYTSNAVGQKIYFTSTDANSDYDVILKGTDDLGNPVEFYTSNYDGMTGIGKMVVDTTENGYVSDKASSLTLTPYVLKLADSNGENSEDYKPIGEAFTISLR